MLYYTYDVILMYVKKACTMIQMLLKESKVKKEPNQTVCDV